MLHIFATFDSCCVSSRIHRKLLLHLLTSSVPFVSVEMSSASDSGGSRTLLPFIWWPLFVVHFSMVVIQRYLITSGMTHCITRRCRASQAQWSARVSCSLHRLQMVWPGELHMTLMTVNHYHLTVSRRCNITIAIVATNIARYSVACYSSVVSVGYLTLLIVADRRLVTF